jgi:hypothetical protein
VETDQVEAQPSSATRPVDVPPQGPAAGKQSYHTTPLPPNPFTHAAGQGASRAVTPPRPYNPQRPPVFMRNATKPYNPQAERPQPAPQRAENGLIGPVGYDVD